MDLCFCLTVCVIIYLQKMIANIDPEIQISQWYTYVKNRRITIYGVSTDVAVAIRAGVITNLVANPSCG